ncbi:hypothetical protein WL29_22955 [Burkholderia ubonensis]|uniref:Uncharacterized protein n=2 Tax=Burkholderia ubonensis TaxID=101571 RepID=A0A106QC93_9BURK|nr:hypothetical protein WL29_22955 [Burkholderia ubonensis]
MHHEARVDALLAKMKTFLMSPDHGDGSWPDIPHEELDKASVLVGEMFDLKWGEDVDGDAPVKVRMWHRGQQHMVCDWAFIDHSPRDEKESTTDQEARWLRNMSTITSASAACAEELRRLHVEMADVHSRKLRKSAAFEVYHVRYKPTPEWDGGAHGRDYPASLHRSEGEAEQFIRERETAGMVVERRSIMLATPSSRDSAADGFAEFRHKVEEHYGKLLPDMKVRQDLGLQPVRIIRKSETAV